MSVSFRVLFRQAVLLVLLALPFGVLTGFFHPQAPVWGDPPLGPGQISLATAMDMEDAVWLDARSRTEYEEAHIPGALLLNEDAWEMLFFDFMTTWIPGQSIIVYCGGSQCQASEKVAERLRSDFEGENVFVLKGGWSEWSQDAMQR